MLMFHSISDTKRKFLSYILGFAMVFQNTVAGMALPLAGHVTSGKSTIRVNGNRMTVQQASSSLSLRWASFNIGQKQTVQFIQPNASSVALNMIGGASPAKILGHLLSNGQIFLLDPYGIIFGKTATIDVGGIVAASTGLSRYGMVSGTGNIVNNGNITASPGGSVGLYGENVYDSGIVTAYAGNVSLIAENTTSVYGVLNASAPEGGNGGQIDTSGSRVNIANGAYIDTSSSNGRTGTWTMDPVSFYIGMNTGPANSTQGNTLYYEDISGSLLSSELATNNIVIDSIQGLKGTQGNIYVDSPVVWNSGNSLTLNAVQNVNVNAPITNSGTGNIVLRADDMNIGGQANPSVGYDSATNTLTGVATGIGTVNMAAATGTAGSLLVYTNPTNYGTALTNPSTGTAYKNADSSGTTTAYDLLSSNPDLYFIDDNTDSGSSSVINTVSSNNYALNTNIVLPNPQSTSLSGANLLQVVYATNDMPGGSYASGASTNSNWVRFGRLLVPFTGSFNGLTHTIANLYSYEPGNTLPYMGFIGDYSGSLVENIGLTNETLIGTITAGGLSGGIGGVVAVQNSGIVENVYSTGSITDTPSGTGTGTNIGGVVGAEASAATVKNSWSSATILSTETSSNNSSFGGVVGLNDGTVVLSHGSGNVTGMGMGGGLVGASSGTINDSYATGNLVGLSPNTSTYEQTGGLVGQNTGSIVNSYATGSVSTPGGWVDLGGLVGAQYGGEIAGAYATGNVYGGTSGFNEGVEGGLVGHAQGTVANSYATGNVFGNDQSGRGGGAGGLIGMLFGTLGNVYSDGRVSTVSGGVNNGGSIGITVSGAVVSGDYYDSSTSGAFPGIWMNQGGNSVSGLTTAQFGNASSFVNYPFNSTTGTGFANDNAWLMGNVTIGGSLSPAPILTGPMGWETITVSPTTYRYNATGYFGPPTVTETTTLGATPLNLSSLTFGGSGIGASNVGAYSIAPGGLTWTPTTQNGINYVVYVSGTLQIDPSLLTLTGIKANNKVYDGTTTATISEPGTLSGLKGGQTLNISAPSSGTFSSPNVGLSDVSIDGYTLENGTGSASNYFLSPVQFTTASIIPANLSLATTATKTYDGNGTISISGADSSVGGLASGQTASVQPLDGVLNSSNVGTNIGGTVSLTSGDISGNTAFESAMAAGDYVLPASFNGGNVTPAPLSITLVNPTKTYDNSTMATLNMADTNVTGFVSGQGISSLNGSGTYSQTGAGTNLTVTATLNSGDMTAMAGTHLSNYSLPSGEVGTGTIVPAKLTINGAGTVQKTYDGTSVSSVGTGNLTVSGLVSSQSLSYDGGQGVFSSANAASSNPVSVTFDKADFSGGNGFSWNNYSLGNSSALIPGTIVPKALGVSTTGEITKTYDGTTSAFVPSGDISLTGLVNGQSAAWVGGGGTFATPNVSPNDPVTATLNPGSFSSSGVLWSNYTLPSTATIPGSITPAILSIQANNALSKIYDGNRNIYVSPQELTVQGLFDNQKLDFSGENGLFAASGISLADPVTIMTGKAVFSGKNGFSWGNYILSQTEVIVPGSIMPIPDFSKYVDASVSGGESVAGLTAAVPQEPSSNISITGCQKKGGCF